MSEQETSRSVGSSSSVSEAGERSQRQEDPSQGPPPPGQCCAVLSSPCIDSADNSGMGNTIFSSSPNDHGDAANNSKEKETPGCDFSKDKSSSNDPGEEVVKDTLSDGAGAGVDLLCSEDTKMHLNHEPSQSGEDNSIPSEQQLEDSVTMFQKRSDLEVNEECTGVVDSETKTDLDREKDNGVAAAEDIESKDCSKSLVSSTECESDESKSTCAEVVVKDTESICQSDEACCQSQLRSTDTLETQELELAERGEGIVVLSKCNNETHPNPESGEGDGGCDKPYSDDIIAAKGDSSSGSTGTMESYISAGSSSNIGQHQEGMIGYSLDATSSTSVVGMDSDNVGLMQMCSVGVDEGFNVVVQGCSTMKTDGCYAPGVDLCVADAIRDTDSEAGDSCCSDEEHGEACRGENGCIHRVAGDTLDQNWDYMVDEEFNVPRKPIFNGSADELERRSNLKRKASEEPEGKLQVRGLKYCWQVRELTQTTVYNYICVQTNSRLHILVP